MRIVEQEEIDPKENRTENIFAILIVLCLVGGIVWWIFAAHSTPAEAQTRVTVPLGAAPTIGTLDANITVVVFSEFECPYCGVFARDTFPTIKERYIDTGEVVFVYKHFPLSQIHPRALRAGVAAACAQDEGKFWEYHDLLYANQDALEVNQLLGHAERLGLNMSRFRPCLINEIRQGTVLQDKQHGISLGVTATPTFFFNGRMVLGALDPEEFAREIETERAASRE